MKLSTPLSTGLERGYHRVLARGPKAFRRTGFPAQEEPLVPGLKAICYTEQQVADLMSFTDTPALYLKGPPAR